VRPHRRLTDAELSVVPDLVLCRLVLSTLLVEYQVAHAPHISDAVAAERPGLLANLGRWLDVDADTAAHHVLEAVRDRP